MKAQFLDLQAAADFLGPGAVEVNRYQTEIFDIVRRRGVFGQRIRQVPATGHPSRFFEQTAIVSPTAAAGFVDPRNIVATVGSPNASGAQRSAEGAGVADQLQPVRPGSGRRSKASSRYLQAKDLADSVEGLMRTHDVALWNGTDTSLGTPTTTQYFGAIGQIEAGGNTHTVATTDSIVDGIKGVVAGMVANSSFEVRPTAIYANPVLLDLIDREMKTEFNVVLSTTEDHGRIASEDAVHASGRFAADSGVGARLHRNAGQRYGGAARATS